MFAVHKLLWEYWGANSNSQEKKKKKKKKKKKTLAQKEKKNSTHPRVSFNTSVIHFNKLCILIAQKRRNSYSKHDYL